MAGRALILLASFGMTHGAARVAESLSRPTPKSMLGNPTRQRESAGDTWQFLERSVTRQVESAERMLAELSCREYLGEDVGEYIRRYEAIRSDLLAVQAEKRQRRPR